MILKAYVTGCVAALMAFAAVAATPPDALIGAVKAGDSAFVQHALDDGADANAAEVDGTTALMWAIDRRHPDVAQLLLDDGADPFAVNRYGMTALHLAAKHGDAATTRALLARGVDPNTSLPGGETALMTAARTGNPEVIKALLSGGAAGAGGPAAQGETPAAIGADPNAKEGWQGQTALMWAAAAGHPEAIRLLAAAGANVDDVSSTIEVPEVRPDRRQGAFIYPDIPTGRMAAIHFAARDGQVESVKALIDVGADLNAVDDDGSNALILATLNGHLDVAAMLLEAGADPNVADKYGRTVLFVATDMHTEDALPRPPPKITGDYDYPDIVAMALKRGADPNVQLKSTLPRWLSQGAGHNPILDKGATPFLRAAMSGDLEIAHLLLDAGADPLMATAEQDKKPRPNFRGEKSGNTTPFMAAAGVGWRTDVSRGRVSDAVEFLKMLVDMGADVNAANQGGNTALHGAALRASPEIAQFLLEHGADVSAKNERGWTPLDIALGQPEYRIPPNEATAEVLRRHTPQTVSENTPAAGAP